MQSDFKLYGDRVINTRFKVVNFESWSEARNFLERLGERYVFRGHGEATWDMESSLRRAWSAHSIDQIEKLLQSDFKAAAHLFEQSLPDPQDLFTWMALMQHHGICRRSGLHG